MGNKIRIALAADHAYASYMEVSIISILKNNNGSEIAFDILDVGLSDVDKEGLKKTILNNSGEFVIHDLKKLDKIIGHRVPAFQGSLGAYARLFLPEILPDIEKVLYLDCDTLNVAGLIDLWECKIDDYYLAGIKDTVSSVHRKRIGLSDNDVYVNSGVILMNLRKWREDGIGDKIIDYIENRKSDITLPDQDGINVVCKNSILELEPKYNVMSPLFLMSYKNIIGYFNLHNYYLENEILKAKKNPVIIHFTGYPDRRPWEKGCKHPRRRLYLKYARCSKIGVNFISKKITRQRRIELIKFRYLPYSIYSIIRRIVKK